MKLRIEIRGEQIFGNEFWNSCLEALDQEFPGIEYEIYKRVENSVFYDLFLDGKRVATHHIPDIIPVEMLEHEIGCFKRTVDRIRRKLNPEILEFEI